VHAKRYFRDESITRLQYESVASLVDRAMTFDLLNSNLQIHFSVASTERLANWEHLTIAGSVPVAGADLLAELTRIAEESARGSFSLIAGTAASTIMSTIAVVPSLLGPAGYDMYVLCFVLLREP
jgi:hypothetical protein